MTGTMHRVWTVAKVLLCAGAVILIFSPQAVTHDAAKAWRCRSDSLMTRYERADSCRPESWR